jgi:riboflavin kinase/FMN adenylyltransferase
LTNGLTKARMITALGIDTLVLLPFTPDLASLSAGQFLASILEHVNLVEMWTGADFAFGYKREGDVGSLERGAGRGL